MYYLVSLSIQMIPSMKPIIEKFYTAFDELDAEKMVACYHPDIQFEDPAFGPLGGERAKNMWRMLCESQKGKDFQVSLIEAESQENTGKASWEATYFFSRTGRKVHNKIEANFVFKDGLIIEHLDHFDLYRWAQQALGWKGTLLGWTSYFKQSLQKQTNHLLDKFEKKTT